MTFERPDETFSTADPAFRSFDVLYVSRRVVAQSGMREFESGEESSAKNENGAAVWPPRRYFNILLARVRCSPRRLLDSRLTACAGGTRVGVTLDHLTALFGVGAAQVGGGPGPLDALGAEFFLG